MSGKSTNPQIAQQIFTPAASRYHPALPQSRPALPASAPSVYSPPSPYPLPSCHSRFSYFLFSPSVFFLSFASLCCLLLLHSVLEPLPPPWPRTAPDLDPPHQTKSMWREGGQVQDARQPRTTARDRGRLLCDIVHGKLHSNRAAERIETAHPDHRQGPGGVRGLRRCAERGQRSGR